MNPSTCKFGTPSVFSSQKYPLGDKNDKTLLNNEMLSSSEFKYQKRGININEFKQSVHSPSIPPKIETAGRIQFMFPLPSESFPSQ